MVILEQVINYLVNNFAFLLATVSFLLIILTHQNLSKKMNRITIIILVLAVIYSILCNVESMLGEKYFAYTKTSIYLRTGLSLLCYICRPTFLLLLLYSLIDEPNLKQKIILWSPIVFCFILYSTSFFLRDGNVVLAFYIDDNNVWHGGFLSFMLYLVAGFYSLLILQYTFKQFRNQNIFEGVIVAVELVAAIVGALVESSTTSSTMLPMVIVVCLIFYYLYLLIEHTKIDQLTGLLNRQSYYNDIGRFSKQITAIISLDMNDLKEINDSNGHLAGDEALQKVSEQFLNSLCKGARLYRVGGDEFEIVCFSLTEEKVKELIETINNNVNQNTPYTVAVGYGYIKPNVIRNEKNIQAMLVEADGNMYRNKASMKKELKRKN